MAKRKKHGNGARGARKRTQTSSHKARSPQHRRHSRSRWLATALVATLVGTGLGATALTADGAADAPKASAAGLRQTYHASASVLPSFRYGVEASARATHTYSVSARQSLPAPPEAPLRRQESRTESDAPTPTEAGGLPQRIENVNITFYDCFEHGFCGRMYSGEQVHQGAAACSWDLPLGTAFRIEGDPTGRVYVCKDRGHLPNTWVDIFWWDPAEGWVWQSLVGRHGTIEIVERSS